MPRTILASLTGLSSDRAVLEAAVATAKIDGGHIECLHTRIDVVQAAALMATASPRRDTDVSALLSKISEQENEHSRHARLVFDDICKRYALAVRDTPGDAAAISVSWKETQSFLNEALHEARYHDLTVMGREKELASQRILSVLMQSGRPLLLAPEKPVDIIGRKVAIAWKATAEAARAVTAASHILARAGGVAILSVSEDSDNSGQMSAEHLARNLAWQGIKAEVRTCQSAQRPTSQALLDMAYDCDADLLVMGAYGHSRIKEFIFGGVTNDLLKASALPLFMVC